MTFKKGDFWGCSRFLHEKKQQKLLRFHQQNPHNTKASEWNLYRISRIDDAQRALSETYLGRFWRNLQPLKVKKTTININILTTKMHWLMIFEVNSITQHWIFWATLHRYIFTNCQPTSTRGFLLDRSLLHLKIFEDLCRNAVARVTWVICPRLRLPLLDLLLAEIHVFSL